MGTKERREREKHETRQLILDAARGLFNELGYAAFTMRALAARIEYTPTAIYHHFANKEALVTELCHEDFGKLAAHFRSLASVADPVERIYGIGESFLQFALQYPHHYRFMFMTARPPDAVPRPDHGNPEEDAYAFFVRTVQEAMQQGRLRPDFTDADEAVQMLWGAAHGVISLQLSMGQDSHIPWRDLQATVRRVNQLMLSAIAGNLSGTPVP